ncbi:MAG TPA: nucleotidyltransferase domain-containing protein [Candidatus Hodarchaeales archaeon]|nr:nucleotidyltransferase domain-containing protein [Candidatus Hodarchaeales archaeon]
MQKVDQDEPLLIVKKLVLSRLNKENVQIFLFGSRARGDFNIRSDIDIGILPQGEWNKLALVLLREEIENLNLPYKIEIVDLSRVSRKFRDQVLREGQTWKD